MSSNQKDRKFFVVFSVLLGFVCFALIFVPPFLREEGGLAGAGVLFAFSVLFWTFAFMVNKG